MLTLVLGGARSGKSRYAQWLAKEHPGDIVLIATARARDEEMARRIARHKTERPERWSVLEEPLAIDEGLRSAPKSSLVIVDCLTIWLSNLLELHRDLDVAEREARIFERVEDLARVARSREVVVVSNEVGDGIVPETPLGREFRDLSGLANQVLARDADRVVLVVAGIPQVLKGEPD